MKLITITSDKECGFEEARAVVRKELRAYAQEHPGRADSSCVLQVKIPLVAFDHLSWLSGQSVLPRVFWHHCSTADAVAGVGAAYSAVCDQRREEKNIWRELESMTDLAPDLRIFLGMSFCDEVTAPEWKSFGALRAFLPRFQVVYREGGHSFICHVLVFKGNIFPLEDVLKELDRLRYAEKISAPVLTVFERKDMPSYETWKEMVRQALTAIDEKDIDKIVLARRTTVLLDRPADPVFLLRALATTAPEAYAFLFQFDPERAFIGMTPELLYKREEKNIRTEAIAGTRKRGNDRLHDDVLRKELLSSDKDRREHRFVIGALADAFRQVCRSYTVNEGRKVLTLPDQQHLCLRLSGRLNEDVSDKDLCLTLHPTPAVGGVPVEKARVYISRWEEFERGWFSSPVGWLGGGAAEIAVGIRSCLVAGDRLHIYAGAGIVEGSDPALEWDEIESKIKGYMDILYGTLS